MLQTLTTTTTEIQDASSGATLERVTGYHGPAVVVVKRLGWRRLEEAANAALREGMRSVREMGGAEALTAFQELVNARRKTQADDGKTDVEVAREVVATETAKDPLAKYDRRELCLMGITTIDGVEKTPEMVDDFDPDVLTGIARTVLHLSRPGLFETEAARKNA